MREREERKERKKRKSNYKPLKGGQLLPSLVYQKHLSSTNLVCFSQKENDLLIVRLRNTDLPLLLGKFTELGLLSCSETWTNLLFHFHLSYGQWEHKRSWHLDLDVRGCRASNLLWVVARFTELCIEVIKSCLLTSIILCI